MSAITWIIEALNNISSYFYDLYLEFYEFPYPVRYAANWFYWLCKQFNSMAWDFYDFSIWVREISNKITQYLSWSTIWSYITSRIPNLEDIRDWFYNWRDHVWGEIKDFWSDAQTTVKGWIDIASQDLKWLTGQISSSLDSLRSEWNNFIKVTLPNLADWTGVNSLISSGLTELTPMIEGWQDFRDRVAEFFSDPEEWLYRAFDRIIERFW